MGRKIKQAGLSLTLLGGAYLCGRAVETGIENYGTLYEKQVLIDHEDQDRKQELSDRSKELSNESKLYFVGLLGAIVVGAGLAVNLRDETVAKQGVELADSPEEDNTQLIKDQANRLFDVNRDAMSRLTEHPHRLELIDSTGQMPSVESGALPLGQGERT